MPTTPTVPKRRTKSSSARPSSMRMRPMVEPLPPRQHRTHHVPIACSLLTLGVVVSLLFSAWILTWQQTLFTKTVQLVQIHDQAILEKLAAIESTRPPVSEVLTPAKESSEELTIERATAMLPDGPGSVAWNSATPTTTVVFTDQEKRVTFRVPYRPDWGTETARVAPYEVKKEGDTTTVSFGPLTYACTEQCAWVRAYTLSILPSRSENEIRSTVQATYPDATPEIHVDRIGTYDVLRIEVNGSSSLEFSGRRANYLYQQRSSTDPNVLEQLLRTLRGI